MRTVLKNNNEVAHIWAQQKQKSGRCGNLFFSGPSIYSYGSHFEIARFVDAETVLFTTRSYSNTTAKHKNAVHRAISHKDIFHVPSLGDHDINALYFIDKVYESKKKALSAISYGEYYIDDMKAAIANGADYVRHFKVNKKLTNRILLIEMLAEENKLFNSQELETLKRRKALAEIRQAKQVETVRLRREALRGEYLINIEKWKTGEIDHAPYNYYDDTTHLRVKDERIETSKGAQITIKTALRLWEAIKLKQSVEGFKLDNYEAAGLSEGVLTVGCHKIPMTELERIAGLLGVAA